MAKDSWPLILYNAKKQDEKAYHIFFQFFGPWGIRNHDPNCALIQEGQAQQVV